MLAARNRTCRTCKPASGSSSHQLSMAGLIACRQAVSRSARVQTAAQAAPFFNFTLPVLPFGNSGKKREEAKEKLLEALNGLKRGADASEEDKEEVDRLASALEKLNPQSKTLNPAVLSGKWRLLYTTSASILGLNRPPPFRPLGDIFQTIDVEKLRARNQESAPFFNAVSADLTPTGSSSVDVQFDTFYILGFIPLKAPASASGSLKVTYVDEELRVSRGDKGNLFVLELADRNARL